MSNSTPLTRAQFVDAAAAIVQGAPQSDQVSAHAALALLRQLLPRELLALESATRAARVFIDESDHTKEQHK